MTGGDPDIRDPEMATQQRGAGPGALRGKPANRPSCHGGPAPPALADTPETDDWAEPSRHWDPCRQTDRRRWGRKEDSAHGVQNTAP